MATSSYSLTATAWTDCGTCPCFIQTVGTVPIQFVVDGSAPGSLDAPSHYLRPQGEMSANISLSGKVFARAAHATATLIVSR